ncbi:MAG: hypothetical protein L0L95_12505 [Staphylococcus equorum]|nr:hypothetical protein [Tetragenococcus koreensis]MDN6751065.1 hypothetical protein [Staphylococcus equorum]
MKTCAKSDFFTVSNIRLDDQNLELSFDIGSDDPDKDCIKRPIRINNVFCRFFKDEGNEEEGEDFGLRLEENDVFGIIFKNSFHRKTINGTLTTNEDLSVYNTVCVVICSEFPPIDKPK